LTDLAQIQTQIDLKERDKNWEPRSYPGYIERIHW
jgi:hypothetical protein